nr:dTDP-4-dehydrorhamnose reductase [Dyella sp. RRB7]
MLGANGQLGRSFIKSGGLARYGEVMFATRDGLLNGTIPVKVADLAHPLAVIELLECTKPDLIINAAAYTAVDQAEDEESLATLINGTALDTIGRWAAPHGSLVVHYSTDYVFDGERSVPYAVDAPTAPINAYGRSKLLGEHLLQASGAAQLIFRTAWVYSAHGHNFLRSMLRLGRERRELRIVNDQFGTPTTTGLIVDATLTALDAWFKTPMGQRETLTGTYHVVSSGMTTWHDFATLIFQKASSAGLLPVAPKVKAIGTKDFPTRAKRPAWTVLDNSSFSQRFDFVLPDWKVGLNDVINELYVEANGSSC